MVHYHMITFIKNRNHFKIELKHFYPYDAIEPVPFSIFLYCTSLEEVEKEISKWKDEVQYKPGRRQGFLYSIEEIWNASQIMLQKIHIPAI